MRVFSVLMILLSLVLPSFAAAEKGKKRKFNAHVHGEAELGIAIEGKQIEMQLATPAEGVFGFEHEPVNDEQESVINLAKNKLKASALVFLKIPQEYGCKTDSAKLTVKLAQVRLSKKDRRRGVKLKDAHKGHGDVVARYMISCQKELKGAKVSVLVSETFPRIKKTKVLVLTDKSQMAKTVTTQAVAFQL